MRSRDERIAPVEDNMVFFVNQVRSAGLDWIVDRVSLGVPAYSSDVPFPLFSLVAGAEFTSSDAEGLAARVGADFIGRGLPWMGWTTPSYTSPELEDSLTGLGMLPNQAPGMYVDLDTVPEVDDQFGIREVPPHDDDFGDTFVAGFGMPPFVRDPMQKLLGAFDGQQQVALLAYRNGHPAGVGNGFITGETLGIYNVATLPEDRGHGVGTAITSALMREGRNRGCTHAILHTSPMGRPVYEKMGFEEVCSTAQWVWLPPQQQ